MKGAQSPAAVLITICKGYKSDIDFWTLCGRVATYLEKCPAVLSCLSIGRGLPDQGCHPVGLTLVVSRPPSGLPDTTVLGQQMLCCCLRY